MKCKKIFLLLICVLLVTGCSAKSYGTKLNKKQVELNKQKISYLSNKYADNEYIFLVNALCENTDIKKVPFR